MNHEKSIFLTWKTASLPIVVFQKHVPSRQAFKVHPADSDGLHGVTRITFVHGIHPEDKRFIHSQ
jgi:hypothetical protein